MKHLLGAVGAATLALVGSAGAAPPSDIEAELTIFNWINPQIISSTEAAIERFSAKYPNVTITPQFVPNDPWGQYISQYLNQAASGDTPDIVGMPIEGFSSLAARGILIDLEEIAAADPAATETLAGIDANLLDGMRTRPGGQLNFFPTEWNNILIYYNKDLFDAAGVGYPPAEWTWDEFLETAKALTVTDGAGNTTQFGYFVPGFNFGITPWFLTNGTDKLDADWAASNMQDAKVSETLQFLHGLIHEHGVAPTFERGVGTDRFVAGQVAMFSAGHWPVRNIIDGGLENVGVTNMPNNGSKTTVFGIGGLAIAKESENQELAWEFIKEMTGPEFQQELADSRISIPSARAFATTEDYLAFPDNAELFYASAAYAQPIASPPNFAQVEDIFISGVENYLTGNTDLESAIAEMDRELSRAMSRVR